MNSVVFCQSRVIRNISYTVRSHCWCFQKGCWGSEAVGHRWIAQTSDACSEGKMSAYSFPGRNCNVEAEMSYNDEDNDDGDDVSCGDGDDNDDDEDDDDNISNKRRTIYI